VLKLSPTFLPSNVQLMTRIILRYILNDCYICVANIRPFSCLFTFSNTGFIVLENTSSDSEISPVPDVKLLMPLLCDAATAVHILHSIEEAREAAALHRAPEKLPPLLLLSHLVGPQLVQVLGASALALTSEEVLESICGGFDGGLLYTRVLSVGGYRCLAQLERPHMIPRDNPRLRAETECATRGRTRRLPSKLQGSKLYERADRLRTARIPRSSWVFMNVCTYIFERGPASRGKNHKDAAAAPTSLGAIADDNERIRSIRRGRPAWFYLAI
ncbi:unnamed protein product, partial [Trichogramma brassicae]